MVIILQNCATIKQQYSPRYERCKLRWETWASLRQPITGSIGKIWALSESTSTSRTKGKPMLRQENGPRNRIAHRACPLQRPSLISQRSSFYQNALWQPSARPVTTSTALRLRLSTRRSLPTPPDSTHTAFRRDATWAHSTLVSVASKFYRVACNWEMMRSCRTLQNWRCDTHSIDRYSTECNCIEHCLCTHSSIRVHIATHGRVAHAPTWIARYDSCGGCNAYSPREQKMQQQRKTAKEVARRKREFKMGGTLAGRCSSDSTPTTIPIAACVFEFSSGWVKWPSGWERRSSRERVDLAC